MLQRVDSFGNSSLPHAKFSTIRSLFSLYPAVDIPASLKSHYDFEVVSGSLTLECGCFELFLFSNS